MEKMNWEHFASELCKMGVTTYSDLDALWKYTQKIIAAPSQTIDFILVSLATGKLRATELSGSQQKKIREFTQQQRNQVKLATSTNDITFGIQADKMRTANRNRQIMMNLIKN